MSGADDDIVTRLTAPIRREHSERLNHIARRLNVERREAANAITALRAERDALTASLAAAEGEVGRLREAVAEVASEALASELPEGYGPDIAKDPEFHRGYDAAISRLRALSAPAS